MEVTCVNCKFLLVKAEGDLCSICVADTYVLVKQRVLYIKKKETQYVQFFKRLTLEEISIECSLLSMHDITLLKGLSQNKC